VTLDADNDVYRLIIPVSQSTDIQHIDFARILGQDIEEDLQRRDFTINAIAWKLKVPVLARIAHSGLIDPRKGLFDIGRKILRAEKDSLFVDDPLRLLRAFRIKAQLNFKIEPGTFKRITRHRRLITRPAGERIQSELMALLTVPGASKILKEMDDGRFLTTLFADLEPARRCAQSYYGTGGVLRHSLDVCSRVDFLFTHFKTIYPDLDAPFKKYLASRMSGGISPKAILLLAALLHDVAKPQTAKMISGRLRFYEHDTQGALRAEKILLAMRFSREHIHTITEVIRHHLRPGHLVASGLPLTDRVIY
jgi:tRNA nucleotidyltransferase/poly(A) polymerase